MKNNLERLLLSFLLGTSILLGLTFWLNIKFGFNLFYAQHWNDLATLRATHTAIDPYFYISIIIAFVIFIIGVFVIFRSTLSSKKTVHIPQNTPMPQPEINKKNEPVVSKKRPINMLRPPRLNLPSNIAEIAEKKYSTQLLQENNQNKYDSEISQIFSENGYIIKPNPRIAGFTPNLFAIGNNEILWIGGIDADITDMQRAIDKLQNVFSETLEDIKIHIKAFILDISKTRQSNDSVLIFQTIDDLRKYISENPGDKISEEDKENFDAYSEYIDTIIQYIKNI